MKSMMKKIKILVSLGLIVILLAWVQIVARDQVFADDYLPFPNIVKNGDVISWDTIEDIYGGIDLDIYTPSSETSRVGFSFYKSVTSVDLYELFSGSAAMAAGTYRCVLSTSDTLGNKYRYECTYVHNYHQLNKVENIRFSGDKLTWDFQDSEVAAGVEIFYEVQVIVDGRDSYRDSYSRLTSASVPSYLVLQEGTHDYKIRIFAYSDVRGYHKSEVLTEIKGYEAHGLPLLSNLDITDGLISWDPYPACTDYRVFVAYRLKGAAGNSVTINYVNTNSFYLLRNVSSNAAEQDITVYVAAIGENGDRKTSYSTVTYHFVNKDIVYYPLYVSGNQLNSNSNLADLFSSRAKGSVRYYPSSNKLVFTDLDNTDTSLRDYSSNNAPLFKSTEPLTVEGKADLINGGEIFLCDKDITFTEGSKITGKAGTTAMKAQNIIVNGNSLELTGLGGEAVTSSGKITISNKTKSVLLQTETAGQAALSARGLVTDYIRITEPQNGRYDSSKKTVCSPDGTPASKVRLVNLGPTATPTPVVKIALDRSKTSVICGKSATIKATLTGSSAKISWKSSDSKVAAVDDSGKVTAKMAGTVTITASAAGKSATCTVTVLYKDVTSSKEFWYAPTNCLTAAGVVKGYDKQTKFKPGNKCTRAQMVTFIWRLAGEPKPKTSTCKFKDVKKTDYFYKACIWGNENHIVEGYKNGTFGPKIVCARKHAVTFLWRLAGKPEPKSTKNKFKDVKKKDYFYKATLWASEKKILAGYKDGTFKPNGACLRRQMVTFLYKYDKFVNGKG